MKFTTILSLASLFALAAAHPAPDKKHSDCCELGTKICDLALTFPECSEEFIKTMKLCLATGCVQFFVDPLANCKDA